MKIPAPLVIALVVIAFGAGYIARQAEEAQAVNYPNGPAIITDGTYGVYAMTKAFDGPSGEPIYWVLADTIRFEAVSSGGTMPVHDGRIRFYSIPRARIANLPADTASEEDSPTPHVTVLTVKGRTITAS